MHTVVINADDSEGLRRAGEIIRNGGLVAFPTETVYGLGASVYNDGALRKIYEAKQRPADNPLIAHICDLDGIKPLVSEIPDMAYVLAQAFWPGPMTLVMKRSNAVSDVMTAGLDTVTVRMPSNITARRLIAEAGVAIAAPSANLSGKPSPTRASHVIADLNGRVDMIIDGGACNIGIESTIIDITGEVPSILRPGGITSEMIEQAIGVKPEIGFRNLKIEGKPKAPGMKYRHYSPEAALILFQPGTDIELIRSNMPEGKCGLVCTVQSADELKNICPDGQIYLCGDEDDLITVSERVFDIFRTADNDGCKVLLMRAVKQDDLGMAIMNRVSKAAKTIL